MGFHKVCGRGTTQRMPHAHLDRRENGDIYAVYKLGFKKDDKAFEYCFIGQGLNTLTFDGEEIPRHPKFKNISQFEAWCNRYCAEHDMD